MSDIITSVFTQFTEETISIFAMFFFLMSCVLTVYWLYNRRKFRQLNHQIPASVVKNYLDSIIQNSTSLKSSLFRGGGLDLGEGTPSIVPLSDLPKGNVEIIDNSEEINQKNAEIAALKAQVGNKDGIITDLEAKLKNSLSGSDGGEEIARLNTEVSAHKDKITELEAALASALAEAGSGGGADEVELAAVKAERDELKERLMEYEIIEEDLANLKRLQQENAELKKALADGGGSVPAPEAVAEPIAEPTPEAVAEAAPETKAAEPESEVEPATEAAAVAEPEPAAEPAAAAPEPEEQKSAEELLSEFEKMLG